MESTIRYADEYTVGILSSDDYTKQAQLARESRSDAVSITIVGVLKQLRQEQEISSRLGRTEFGITFFRKVDAPPEVRVTEEEFSIAVDKLRVHLEAAGWRTDKGVNDHGTTLSVVNQEWAEKHRRSVDVVS